MLATPQGSDGSVILRGAPAFQFPIFKGEAK